MPVVQLQPREHFSTLAGVTGGIAEMLSAIMQTREYNAEQKRQEDERRRAKEFQDFDIAMKLRQAAIEEASVPEFGERPMEDKTTQIPVQSKTGGYLASLVPGAAPPQPPPIELGPQPPLPVASTAPMPPPPPPAPPLRTETVPMEFTTSAPKPVETVTIPPLQFQGKTVAGERKIPKLYQGDIVRMEAEKKRAERLASKDYIPWNPAQFSPEEVAAMPPAIVGMLSQIPAGTPIPVDSIMGSAMKAIAEKQKSPWSRPYTGPDGYSYQTNDQSGEVRRTPGVGKKVKEEATTDVIPRIAGADYSKVGDEFLATLPVNLRGPVSKVAAYEASPNSFGRGKERTAIVAAATQVNPEYDDTLYEPRRKTRLDFTNSRGVAGANIVALNTAVQHLDKMEKLSAGLAGTDIKKWNQFVNYAKTNFAGSPSVTNFQTAATAVESEIASLLKKAGATDQEIKVWRDNFSANMSQRQIKGAIDTALELMQGRADALQYQWHLGMGERVKDFPIYGPGQRKILARLGYGAEALPQNLKLEGPMMIVEEK